MGEPSTQDSGAHHIKECNREGVVAEVGGGCRKGIAEEIRGGCKKDDVPHRDLRKGKVTYNKIGRSRMHCNQGEEQHQKTCDYTESGTELTGRQTHHRIRGKGTSTERGDCNKNLPSYRHADRAGVTTAIHKVQIHKRRWIEKKQPPTNKNQQDPV